MRLRFAIALGLGLPITACGQPGTSDAEPGASKSDQSEAVALGTRPKSFGQCAVCHSVELGQNGLGPTLAGVFEAKAGHVGDYSYSGAMRESGLVWDEASLNAYLENPQGTVPGTKMSYRGMKDAEKRTAIIAYLKTL